MKTETTYEIIDPPLMIAGQWAELAMVVRQYTTLAGNPEKEPELTATEVTVVWGKTIDDVLRQLDAQNHMEAAHVNARVAERTTTIAKLHAAQESKNGSTPVTSGDQGTPGQGALDG